MTFRGKRFKIVRLSVVAAAVASLAAISHADSLTLGPSGTFTTQQISAANQLLACMLGPCNNSQYSPTGFSTSYVAPPAPAITPVVTAVVAPVITTNTNSNPFGFNPFAFNPFGGFNTAYTTSTPSLYAQLGLTPPAGVIDTQPSVYTTIATNTPTILPETPGSDPVPEPASLGLALVGTGGLILLRGRIYSNRKHARPR